MQPTSTPATVFLSLGTNLGDRLHNLHSALHAMPGAAAGDLSILARSRVYETPPWGYLDQPAFLNMAVKCETSLTPGLLLVHLKRLEKDLGRVDSLRWGPRAIDIDILFYADLVLDTPDLVIPHPHLQERAFVLVPLADIAPDLVHPLLHKTVSALLASVDASAIRPFAQQL
jgi:2-amino-4-hydroxy-6-hydroxymethyldihydropteridine diphosphokinase